jgi:alpha-methylacyl-CoA racemase
MGPLRGITVVELAAIGPAPFCGMVLADLGADVVRIDRPGGPGAPPGPLERSRRSVVVDLKHPEAAGVVMRMVEGADVLVEGFRPGVMERLGIGPEPCLERNPALVYGRVTGWGREGPLARDAGHDIDYLAVAGALHPIGPAGRPPVPPLNLVGDFGGGGMLLANGILAALVERAGSGRGQVVDAAMVDGAALLTAFVHGLVAAGVWTGERGANLFDGGAPFYDAYECADGRFLAIGALEPAFYETLIDLLGLDPASVPDRMDRTRWAELREAIAGAVRRRTRDEWAAVFAGRDACAAPVLALDEAPAHPHNRQRRTFVEVGGVVQPAPAPRFSATPAADPSPPRPPGADTGTVLAGFGFDPQEISSLRESGTVA